MGETDMPKQLIRSPWFPFGTSPRAGIRLLCLPHAGAGATTYRAWGSGVPRYIGVCPAQPPGREKRRREQPMSTVEAIASRLAQEIAEHVSPPYAIFGHST